MKGFSKQKGYCLVGVFLLCLVLASCANKKDDPLESERSLYEAAQEALDKKQYQIALEKYRKINLQYPFGRYAEQAQLESIYAYYQNDELAAANVSAERFIRQYPEHPNLDYAYYLKGLSNYHIDNSLASRFLENASQKRDLSLAKNAFRDFDTLIRRFPDSDYAADAQKRMLYIRDLVAAQEIEIAHYYLQRTAYVAAVNRAKAVVENYPGTKASADALAVQVHAYREMKLPELAEDSLRVLKHNFPDYEKLQDDGSLAAYDKLYQEDINWLNFISFGFLGSNPNENQLSNDSVQKEAGSKSDAPDPPAQEDP